MMISYDIYDRFTMKHFPMCQSMILTTSFFLLATVVHLTQSLMSQNLTVSWKKDIT
jgi:hypothetical protein